MGIKREALKGGGVLRALVAQFYADRTEQNLFAMLQCLRDSYVWIPYLVKIGDADIEKFRHAKEGETVTLDAEARLVPDILKNGDSLFFPVFSGLDQMGEYGSHFSKMEKHFFEAMAMAMAHEEVVGIVLDAFTRPYVLEKGFFDIVGKLPTNVDDETT